MLLLKLIGNHLWVSPMAQSHLALKGQIQCHSDLEVLHLMKKWVRPYVAFIIVAISHLTLIEFERFEFKFQSYIL